MLIETSGWTKDVPEGVESRLIFSEEPDNQTIEKLRTIYPAIV